MNLGQLSSDNETVAYVWSFSNKMSDIPYIVSRTGSPKSMGGKGINWKCSCPAFTNRRLKTCKHILALAQAAKDGTLLSDNRFNITDFGLKIFKL